MENGERRGLCFEAGDINVGSGSGSGVEFYSDITPATVWLSRALPLLLVSLNTFSVQGTYTKPSLSTIILNLLSIWNISHVIRLFSVRLCLEQNCLWEEQTCGNQEKKNSYNNFPYTFYNIVFSFCLSFNYILYLISHFVVFTY